jgi:shikimate dehydrogenase
MNVLVRTLQDKQKMQPFTTATAGEPRRYTVGLVGAELDASLSPALHEREAAALGLRYVYERLDLATFGLEPHDTGMLLGEVQRAGFAGVNVTHPCKQVVVEHLDELSPVARTLGAVNTVVFSDGRRHGHNTDGSGFRRGFIEGLAGAALDRVVVLGAGGAGAAVAYALLALGSQRLTVIDVEPERAVELAQTLERHFGAGRADAAPMDELEAGLHAADGLAHATPTGMAAHPGPPFPPEWLQSAPWVAEVVYRPLETELLRAARAAGCRTLDGGRMAVFQAAEAFELFTGAHVDRRRMLRHFATLVGADDRQSTAEVVAR